MRAPTDSGLELVVLEGIARTFGHGPSAVVALHGVSTEVHPGERIAVVGVSGSGKSTLLQILAGIDEPSAGEVRWPALGDRASLRPRQVGLVLQGPSLLPPLDVAENVALPLLLGGVEPAAAAIEADLALARLDLSDLATKLPGELSGGQSQRVAVARCLASRPRLLLADEPTGQLDHATGGQVVDALFEAAGGSGAALVVATHDPEVADRFDRRWDIVDGELIEKDRSSCSA